MLRGCELKREKEKNLGSIFSYLNRSSFARLSDEILKSCDRKVIFRYMSLQIREIQPPFTYFLHALLANLSPGLAESTRLADVQVSIARSAERA